MSAKNRRDGRIAREIQSELGCTYTHALRYVRACLKRARERGVTLRDSEIRSQARNASLKAELEAVSVPCPTCGLNVLQTDEQGRCYVCKTQIRQ